MWSEALIFGFGVSLAIMTIFCTCWWAALRSVKCWKYYRNPWIEMENQRMFFQRKYKNGCADYDPRQIIWAEFHCALCGKDTDINITRVTETFQFDRERRCPHCGHIDSADREKNLNAQLEKLTFDKSKIEVQIDKLERELNEIGTETTNGVEK